MTTAYSVEIQKQRYSQELAAYTMQQWNAVRQTIEQNKRNGSKSPMDITPSPLDSAEQAQPGRDAAESWPRTAPTGTYAEPIRKQY
ncbi:hypothetical protein DENSPDRAFT_833881 [Dentipellis sp. KUC8613]|nr:hypothetical protein DENSPDRAFT_833881 [Dentipellis sp. KUC8613]